MVPIELSTLIVFLCSYVRGSITKERREIMEIHRQTSLALAFADILEQMQQERIIELDKDRGLNPEELMEFFDVVTIQN